MSNLHEDHHREIKELRSWGWTVPELARQFQVTEDYLTYDVLKEKAHPGYAKKLTAEDAATIRWKRSIGVTVGMLATEFAVAKSTIVDVVKGRTWVGA